MSGWKPVDMNEERFVEWLDRLPSDEIELSEHGEGDFAVIAGRRIIAMQLDGQLYQARQNQFSVSAPLTPVGGKLEARVTRSMSVSPEWPTKRCRRPSRTRSWIRPRNRPMALPMAICGTARCAAR
jgi:hypothetical protein